VKQSDFENTIATGRFYLEKEGADRRLSSSSSDSRIMEGEYRRWLNCPPWHLVLWDPQLLLKIKLLVGIEINFGLLYLGT